MPTNCEPWPGNTTAMRRRPSLSVCSMPISPSPLHCDPAVDGEDLSGDVGGSVRDQEGDRLGDVLRLAEAALRDLSQDLLLDLLGQPAGQLGRDEAGCDRVDGHA